MYIKVIQFIDAAHQLPKETQGLTTMKCTNLHGHTYKIQVEVEEMEQEGAHPMLIDFDLIRSEVNKLDHVFLNDIFKTIPTTAENIARYLVARICNILLPILRQELVVVSVTVYEGYKGEDHSSAARFQNDLCRVGGDIIPVILYGVDGSLHTIKELEDSTIE